MPCINCGNEEVNRVASGGDPYFSVRFVKQVLHAHEVVRDGDTRDAATVYERGSRHYLPFSFLVKLPREAFEFKPRSLEEFFNSLIEEVSDEVEGSEVMEPPVPNFGEHGE